MDRASKGFGLWTVYIAVFIPQIITWFILYPVAGYNDVTVAIAGGSHLVLGLCLILWYKLDWRRIGMGWDRLLKALVAAGLSHGFLLLIGFSLRELGIDMVLLRKQYNLYAFVSNWSLTGLGEELLFAGVIFNLMICRLNGQRRWIAVISVALIFMFWHLPGYLAIWIYTSNITIFYKLILNFLSWVVFGVIYLSSGNLWLTAIAHASTDYTLLPMLLDVPFLGLVFMISLAGWGRLSCRWGRADPSLTLIGG